MTREKLHTCRRNAVEVEVVGSVEVAAGGGGGGDDKTEGGVAIEGFVVIDT